MHAYDISFHTHNVHNAVGNLFYCARRYITCNKISIDTLYPHTKTKIFFLQDVSNYNTTITILGRGGEFIQNKRSCSSKDTAVLSTISNIVLKL